MFSSLPSYKPTSSSHKKIKFLSPSNTEVTTSTQILPEINSIVISELFNLCEKYSLPVPKLTITSHLKKANGLFRVSYTRGDTAYTDKSLDNLEILLSLQLLLPQNPTIYAIKTLRHEFAHYYCYIHHSNLSHDSQFLDFCLQIDAHVNSHYASLDPKFKAIEAPNSAYVSTQLEKVYFCPNHPNIKHSSLRAISPKIKYRKCCPHCYTNLGSYILQK